jgi:hypothetical protein
MPLFVMMMTPNGINFFAVIADGQAEHGQLTPVTYVVHSERGQIARSRLAKQLPNIPGQHCVPHSETGACPTHGGHAKSSS